MATMINANQLKAGSKIIYQGKLAKVISADWVKPGKGGAFAQLKLRYIIEKNQTDIRLRSDEKVEKASIQSVDMEYIYKDGDRLCFMNLESYDQIFLDSSLIADSEKFLLPNTKVSVEYFKETPIGVTLPRTVTLKIVDTEPVMKTATLTSAPKPALLETGLSIMVPNFIENGEKIIVDTELSSYLERAKD